GGAFAVTHHPFISLTGGTAYINISHWSTSKTPSYTKSVSWQHYLQVTKKLTFTTNTPLLHAHLCPMFPPHRGINHQ
ncbi:hypothetical protein, partial [Escherichia coli]|uniref:hypothetical protein n=1 Tax=Escherichia coli TaxID=562 RepID=UPI00292A33FF